MQLRNALWGGVVGAFLLFPPAAVGAGQPQQVRTVKVAVMPYLSHLPFLIAEKEGYLAEQGLRLELVRFARSPEATPALARGLLDAAGGFMSVNMLNAMARDARIRFVADRGYVNPSGCNYAGLLARRELVESGRLKDPTQLKGLRFAINEATIEGFFVERLLRRVGLGLGDIQPGDVPEPVMIGALEKGQVDLVSTSEPWVTRITESGHGLLWKSFQEELPESQFAFLLYGPALLDQEPETGRKFMIAYLKAVNQLALGKTDRNLALAAELTKLELPLLKRACWPSFRPGGGINVRSVLEFQAWAQKKGYLDRVLGETEFWEPHFVEHARKVLP